MLWSRPLSKHRTALHHEDPDCGNKRTVQLKMDQWLKTGRIKRKLTFWDIWKSAKTWWIKPQQLRMVKCQRLRYRACRKVVKLVVSNPPPFKKSLQRLRKIPQLDYIQFGFFWNGGEEDLKPQCFLLWNVGQRDNETCKVRAPFEN